MKFDPREELCRLAAATKAEVIGAKHVREAQHALLLSTAVRAFGDDPRCTLFIEGVAPNTRIPRPDLILIHPHVGVLVVENKGVKLADVQNVENTTLTLVRDGRLTEEDPFLQAERLMFVLRDLVKKRADLCEVLFLNTAALPRIPRGELETRFQLHWPDEALFAEECTDPVRFKAHVIGFSDYAQRRAKRSQKLSLRAREAVMLVLSGKGFLYAPRTQYLESSDPKLLGAQIQEMELALKEATHQQKEWGKQDLRGNHRLFRGVAGSGKSIMLALSVAHTLLKYREESTAGLFEQARPKPRVLVCCFNKTLVPYLRQRIDDRFGRLAWDKPDEESLAVTHFEGLVHRLLRQAPALDTKLTFREKGERARRMASALDSLDPTARNPLLFDAVYIDEAQDLEPAEIQLLLKLARPDDKGRQTFILFYDNAQNIYGVPTPTWSDVGVNIVGRTEFLDQCLRNTRQIVELAFNVLVGSYAAEGERVTTRGFADVQSLRQRGLIEERDGRFEVHFVPRSGPAPVIRSYDSRRAEVEGTVREIRRLIVGERVAPSDILILYQSHWAYREELPRLLQDALGSRCRLKLVDKEHEENKKLPLVEEGVMVASTIASAKGYDAPVVFLLGVDMLGTTTQDRATFYVAATRAKLFLKLSGVRGCKEGLQEEVRGCLPRASLRAAANDPPRARPGSNRAEV